MEQTTNQNSRILTKLTNVQSVKMATRLLLSLSVLSFIFSQSYLLSLLRFLNFCLSTFTYQLFTRTIDKNCMFLLCNGLLVFLAKYSGLIRFLSLSSLRDESDDDSKSMFIDVSQSDLTRISLCNKEVIVLENEVCVDISPAQNVAIEGENKKVFFAKEGEIEVEEVSVEDKEDEQGSKLADSNVAEDDEEESALVHKEVEEEEEEEEEELGNGKLSTEELNKKFDEFIRRMKEELRIEAQRHLIIV